MKNYVIATIKPWNIEFFKKFVEKRRENYILITEPEQLTLDLMSNLNPRYIFFPHWSWRVPREIYEGYECICFHASDVPYGRGGSPIQNLILAGHEITKVTALRMVETLDAGSVYMKKEMSLAGRAQDVYERLVKQVLLMMEYIILNEPQAEPQKGEVVMFRRRKPEESILPKDVDLKKTYDHVRMLDADSYPVAFIEYGNFRMEFRYAKFENNEIKAEVVIKKKTGGK